MSDEQIRHLEDIADGALHLRARHSPRHLLRVFIRSQQPDHLKAAFLKMYRAGFGIEHWGSAELVQFLPVLFRSIDQLFFFGLLTRKTQPFVDPLGDEVCDSQIDPENNPYYVAKVIPPENDGRPVRLQILHETHETRIGCWRPSARVLEVYTKWSANMSTGPKNSKRDICLDEIILTMVHESCHAFIDLFADPSAPGIEKDINYDRGHGQLFWDYNRHVVGILMADSWMGRSKPMARYYKKCAAS